MSADFSLSFELNIKDAVQYLPKTKLVDKNPAMFLSDFWKCCKLSFVTQTASVSPSKHNTYIVLMRSSSQATERRQISTT